jgi:hypothetical protein
MRSMMKKLIMTLMLLSVAVPAFALGPVDAMTCKQVKLKAANNRTVLVRRLTGEVLYAKQYDGSWVKVEGDKKEKYQSLYNAQVHPK